MSLAGSHCFRAPSLDAVVLPLVGFHARTQGTVVTDRGPNSAESRWGADFGLKASIISKEETTEKAVSGQAKGCSLINLPPGKAEQFRHQVKMSAATRIGTLSDCWQTAH